jgi:TRAP-type transport system periplasmic protein
MASGISPIARSVRKPADLAGMRIRVLPSRVQAQTFELLGAIPLRWDLTEALAAIAAGTIDAQENPLANTVTYGAHKFHHFHTLTSHFYVSRPVFLHRDAFDAWPKELQGAMRKAVADSVALQRDSAVEEERDARKAIQDQGCEIIEVSSDEHEAFAAAVRPLHREARDIYGKDLLGLLPVLSA